MREQQDLERNLKSRPYASLWWTAAISGYVSPSQWMEWADRRIRKFKDVPYWIIDLSCAKDVSDLEKALLEKRLSEMQTITSQQEVEDVVLGYFWLRHLRGEYDLPLCLEMSGNYADAYTTDIECEEFYELLSRLNHGEDMLLEASRLYDPLANAARKQWAALHDEGCDGQVPNAI